jgi:hypothetical protein
MDGLLLRDRLHHLSALGRLRQQFGNGNDQQLAAEFQLVFAVAVGQKTIVPDVLKTGRQCQAVYG